jgi:transcriptional regulator with XRE-family HTH domain
MIKLFLQELQAQGWTQEAIAAKIGVRQSHISKLLKGGDCKTSTVVKIALAFNVSADKILGIDGAKEKQGGNNYHGEPKPKAERPKAGVA